MTICHPCAAVVQPDAGPHPVLTARHKTAGGWVQTCKFQTASPACARCPQSLGGLGGSLPRALWRSDGSRVRGCLVANEACRDQPSNDLDRLLLLGMTSARGNRIQTRGRIGSAAKTIVRRTSRRRWREHPNPYAARAVELPPGKYLD